MNESFLPNVFNTDHAKNALLSHLPIAFLQDRVVHSNRVECVLTAKVLSSLGFNVDVCQYDADVAGLEYAKYSLIYGMGRQLQDIFRQGLELPLLVYYGAGMAIPAYMLQIEKAKRYFYSRHKKVFMDSLRLGISEFPAAQFLSDAYIVLGGAPQVASYRAINPAKQVLPQNAPYFTRAKQESVLRKNYAKAKKQYLWIGSIGLIGKGLDVALEVFAERPDLTLHICCLTQEKDFFACYADILSLPNIVFHGFMDLCSSKFASLADRCAFAVSSSWSEGQSTSVVNAMACGLVPLITADCGIEEDAAAIRLADQTKGSLRLALQVCDAMPEEQVREMAFELWATTKTRHGRKAYCDQLRDNMLRIFAELRPQWCETPGAPA